MQQQEKKALLSESKPLIIEDREQAFNEFQVVTMCVKVQLKVLIDLLNSI